MTRSAHTASPCCLAATTVTILHCTWAHIAIAASVGNGGTWSCSCVSPRMYAGGSRSVRMDADWPALMNVGPSSVRSVASCAGGPSRHVVSCRVGRVGRAKCRGSRAVCSTAMAQMRAWRDAIHS